MPSRHPLPAQLPSSAVSALLEGEIIQAIRVVRQSENVGFSEAKRRVERHIRCDPVLRRYWERRRYAARYLISRFLWRAVIVFTGIWVGIELFH